FLFAAAATISIYTLSLHDALPISNSGRVAREHVIDDVAVDVLQRADLEAGGWRRRERQLEAESARDRRERDPLRERRQKHHEEDDVEDHLRSGNTHHERERGKRNRDGPLESDPGD